MDDPSAAVRARSALWGTVGWIVAGLAISYVFHWDAQQALQSGMLRNTFLLAAVASLLLGIFSLTLPRHAAACRDGRTADRWRQMLGARRA